MENETLNIKLLQSSILHAALKMKYFAKDVFSKCINVHWDTSISSQDWNCDGVCSKFLWITNSNDHTRPWTLKFLHAMQLPNPLCHKESSIKYVGKLFRKTNISYPPWYAHVRLVFPKILRTYLMDNTKGLSSKLPVSVG